MRIKWFSLVRITGLLLVLLYHYFQGVFPGGFIGVDIFFTFSGFLITALLFQTAFLSDCTPSGLYDFGRYALYFLNP